MTLSPYQFSYNGLQFGVGTEIGITQITGLRDMPPLRTQDSPNLRAPGDTYGIDVIGARTVQISLLVVATADLETQLTNIETAFTPLQSTTAAFTFQLPNQAQNRTFQARCQRRTLPIDNLYVYGYVQPVVELRAADPRIYDVTTQTLTLSATVTNAGDFETRPKVTLSGAASGTTVTNSTDGGGFVKVQTGLGIPGTVVIDLNARTITDGSGNLRMDLMDPTSTWFRLLPGANSVSVSGGGTAIIAWSNAWLQ